MTARVARAGSDLVVIAYGAMVWSALEATEDLDGASVEVLDLRSLVPLDEEAILDSVARCSKVVIVDEANADVRRRRAGRGADRRAGLRGPRRAGRARRHAGRADPVLAAARAGGAAQRRATSGRRAVSSSPTDDATAPGTVEVTMPQMGVSVAEGTVVAWHKRVGDWVKADETICEISTDKIDTEVPAPVAGRLAEIVVEVDETVPVGAVLARIAVDAVAGEATPPNSARGGAMAGPAGRRAPPRATRPRRRAGSPAALHLAGGAGPGGATGARRGRGAAPLLAGGAAHRRRARESIWTKCRAPAAAAACASRTCGSLGEAAEKEQAPPPLHIESPYREGEPDAGPLSPRPRLRPRTRAEARRTRRGAAGDVRRCRACAARSPSTWCARCTPPRTARRSPRPTCRESTRPAGRWASATCPSSPAAWSTRCALTRSSTRRSTARR